MQANQPNQPISDPYFHLKFTVKGGDVSPNGVYQWMTVLNAHGGPSARASMLLNRHNGDLIGKPVGLFSQVLAPDRSFSLESRLDSLASSTLPPATGGDITASVLRIDYRRGSVSFSREFNAMNSGFIAAIDPAMRELRALMSELLAWPESALSISVETTQDRRFGVKMTNIGTRDLMIADPRILTSVSPSGRASVRVAAAPAQIPGQMEIPPRWQRLVLEPAGLGVRDAGITVKPNQSFIAVTFPWVSPGPGMYLAQAVWEDYSGPALVDPLKVQPAIPDSADLSPKLLLMRGAAFSRYLNFSA